jgi:hypothetical protein
VELDVRRFEEHHAAGRREEALSTYGGDLLAGFRLEGAPGFERWLDARRQDLRIRAVDAATTLADRAEARGSLVEAVTWVRRARTFAPSSEGSLRRHMELLHRMGKRSKALEEYARAKAFLRSELGTAPDEDTQALAARLRSREAPGAEAGEEGPITPDPGAPAPGSSRASPPSSVEGSEGSRRSPHHSWRIAFLPALVRRSAGRPDPSPRVEPGWCRRSDGGRRPGAGCR